MHFLSQCDDMTCQKTYPADLPKCPHCGADAAFSKPAPLDPRDWVYDEETYPNIYTCDLTHLATGMHLLYEISDRKNQIHELREFVMNMGRSGARMVGFNNQGFDYPVLHWIMNHPGATVEDIYNYAMSVIKSDSKFGVVVWDNEQIVPQIDLFKIHHFDNRAKSQSLKGLEIAMRSRNVRDLPFPVGAYLTDDQKDVLISYNAHDTAETGKFYVRSLPEIHLRESLSEKYRVNMMNFSNTKIGGTILVTQMEAAGIQCYEYPVIGQREYFSDDGFMVSEPIRSSKRTPRQTVRDKVRFADVIFPYVRFERPEFNAILDLFRSREITAAEVQEGEKATLKTKGVFKDLIATIDGFNFVFGVGGIHGSIESQIVYSNDDYQIVDADVTSFYPRMAIVNKMFPAHLGEAYCTIYNSIFEQRAEFKKGTPENAALKEALNASYGNSNNKYSPLYDPAYTMQTTVNGQLMLCMLAEQLIKIPGLTMIQANTDGLTYRCPRQYLEHADNVCKWWMGVTGLELEYANYSRMIIRDVNNYIAVYDSGKVKRKGAYEHVYQWHQDPSAVIVPKAAEAALVHGKDIREFITSHRDPFDFMLRAKVPRGSQLMLRWPHWDVEQELQHITRYFVSRNGGSLVKVSPPTETPGTWKRKAKITDEIYLAVMAELATRDIDFTDLDNVDTNGVLWDARIHTGNRSKHDTRELGICVGNTVTECADAADFDWSTLDYEYYIREAEKLVLPLLTSASK